MAIESQQGTSIPPQSVIIDDRSAVWTVVGGGVRRNGVATLSSSVTTLLYYNHVVYHMNKAGYWWKWNNAITVGNAWVKVANPTPTPAPELPVGETKVDFYQDGELVNSTKIVPNGS